MSNKTERQLKLNKAPASLTQCPLPSLDWSRPQAPAARDFGDIYFSIDGGLEETRTVFLGGCGLPAGWQGRRHYTIGELGFGSGLNFLTTLQMWEQSAPKDARLHFISIEKFPFDAAQLQKALSLWPELSKYAAQLISAWPGRVKGFHRLHFGSVTLTLIHDDITPALDTLDAQIDAWFLDGFSPVKNPDMWSSSIMMKLASLSAPQARLATFTVAGTVRKALSGAGFNVEKKTGFGRKRHRLEASFLKPVSEGISIKRVNKPAPTIIGSGIGGAALARAFMRRGIVPKLITQGNGHAASGNAAALIKPRLDLQDRPESRFFLASYLYALQAYAGADNIISRGITQIPKTDMEAARFKKITAQAPIDVQHLNFENNLLSYPQALTVKPADIIKSWTNGIDITHQEVTSLDDIDGPVFAAIGYGIKPFLENGSDIFKLNPDKPELRYSRGQVSWAASSDKVSGTLSYGGYAIPIADRILIGATHGPVVDDPYALQTEDDANNLSQFQSVMGHSLHPADPLASRASVRVVSTNTLPMILHPKPNQYILTGLGSRGFVFAPLLAETIVSRWLGEPLPVSSKVWTRFGPR
ncbi:MAG: tRNA (5-methylaminomethyl-2-thiouridine)(34)-methyltransferase MnmD [Litorimonas sp.]